MKPLSVDTQRSRSVSLFQICIALKAGEQQCSLQLFMNLRLHCVRKTTSFMPLGFGEKTEYSFTSNQSHMGN